MVRLLMILTMLTSLNAAADMADPSKAGANSVSATLSFGWPSAIIGAQYEHMIKDSLTIGAHLRLFPKNTSASNSRNGYMVIGATAGHHFYKKEWDLSFTPSLNIINIDAASATGKDVTTLAPGLSLGILYQFTNSIAAGFDYSHYHVWFDSNYAGASLDDLALRGRFSF